jgi:hypothetical protein
MNNESLEEEKKLRRLRFIVDFALEFIRTQDINHDSVHRGRREKTYLKIISRKRRSIRYYLRAAI